MPKYIYDRVIQPNKYCAFYSYVCQGFPAQIYLPWPASHWTCWDDDADAAIDNVLFGWITSKGCKQ